jgi:hypothetical protein
VYELRATEGDQVAEPIAPLVLDPGDRREVQLTVTPGATLVGTVVDAVTQHPLPGARVIVAEDALSTSPHALVADAAGRFTVRGLLHRPHQVSARAPGYVPRVGTLAIPDAAPITVPLDRQVALTGRVVDSRGAPIAGAQIEVQVRDLDGRVSWLTASAIAFRDALFAAQSRGPRPLIPAGELGVMPGPIPVIPLAQQNGTPSTVFTGDSTHAGYVTDADGRFHVDEVPPGVVTVVGTHPAYVRGESTQRVARAGDALDVEIVLHSGGTIDGRLVDDRGFPVPGQPIEVRSTDDPVPRRAFTSRDGTFRVSSVLGHVAVVALVGGRVGARAEADVVDDAIVPVELVLDRGVRRVRGRVLDSHGFPVAGADLAVASEHGPAAIHTLSTADGTFDTVITGEGSVQFDVRHPAFAPRSMRVSIVGDDVSITLEEGATAVVTVAGAECATGDVSVELRTPCGPYRRNLHGVGEWRVEHVCGGRAVAIASAPGCVRVERSATVPASGTGEVPALDLVGGGSATGEVVDLHGDPVPGAVVVVADAPPDSTTGVARSGRRGEFTVTDVPDGDQVLVALHPVLGRSRTDTVRIFRGTIAHGARLVFDRDLAGASTSAASVPVLFSERAGRVEVRFVASDSAAARAGLQPGDEVVAIQGRHVTNAADAASALRGPAGDEVAIDVTREGTARTVRWLREATP